MLDKLSNRNKIMILILVVFIVWMVFFDENSYLVHRELNKEINKLEETTDYYKKEIAKDTKMIVDLNNPKSLEKFAREKYKMKKEGEAIFIIEFDSISK